MGQRELADVFYAKSTVARTVSKMVTAPVLQAHRPRRKNLHRAYAPFGAVCARSKPAASSVTSVSTSSEPITGWAYQDPGLTSGTLPLPDTRMCPGSGRLRATRKVPADQPGSGGTLATAPGYAAAGLGR